MKRNKSTLLTLLLSTSLALSFNACSSDNYTDATNITGTDVTVVDGYVKNANVTDANGQQATLKDASKGIYTFADFPAYPIKSTNGILAATDLAFDINMSTYEGFIISPISTIIGSDTDISSNLLTSLAIADNAALQSDYISDNNEDLAKLAQVCYTILKDSAATTAFKASLKDATPENNITDIIDIALIDSNSSAEKTQMQTYLNAVKAFSGDANTIETQLLETKAKLVYATPLTRAQLDSLISSYSADSTNLQAMPVKYANTSEITDFSQLLKDKPNFNLNISRWDTSKVTDMNETFSGATGFDQNLSGWDVSSVTVYDDFNASTSIWDSDSQPEFTVAGAALSIAELDTLIANYTTAQTNGDTNETELADLVINADTSAITDMSYLFFEKNNFNLNISAWDTSNVTDMLGLFASATAFNGDISTWDTSSVTNMYSMFKNANAFNGNISGWNVSKVTNMGQMFYQASAFNQDISSWVPSSVTNMYYMFAYATAFKDQNLSSWDGSNISFGDHYNFYYNIDGNNNTEPTW